MFNLTFNLYCYRIFVRDGIIFILYMSLSTAVADEQKLMLHCMRQH